MPQTRPYLCISAQGHLLLGKGKKKLSRPKGGGRGRLPRRRCGGKEQQRRAEKGSEISLSTRPHTPRPRPMASQSSTPAESAAPSPAAASTAEAAPSPASSTPSQNPTAAATAAAGGTDLEKKMRRAERFGTQVVMSEEEKRSSRAER